MGGQKEFPSISPSDFSLIVTLFLFARCRKWFSFRDYRAPYRYIYGLPEAVREANAIMGKNQTAKNAVAVTNWTMGSRIMYYGLPYHLRVFVIDERTDQFDYWEKSSPLGYDLLFINTHFHRAVLPSGTV